MTYQEIKDRLSKCELTLEKLKSSANYSKPEMQKEIKKLTVLKETYEKHLNEKAKKTAFIDGRAVDIEDKDDLDKFKDNNDIDSIETGDGKKIKENEGTKFSVDETKSIAKKVGKAVAQSLRALGDAVHSMKAKRIEENSFEIEVNFKGQGPNDEFSFYIVDDTLHLTDFSFDKEIADVGVKPSGEALVNVDVVANELTKHFKSLNEDEEEDARNDADYERGWHDDPRADEALKEAPEGMSYIEVSVRDARKAMDIMDDRYGGQFEMNGSTVYYFKDDSIAYDAMMDLGAQDIEILDTNIEESVKEGEVDKEADRGDLDVGHQDDEPNMLKSSAFETAEYAAKLVKKLDMYDKHDGEVDFPNWWQKKLILARDYMSAAFHYLDSQEKQPAIDQLALENVDKVAGGIPYKREGNKFIITEPLDDATKERIISRAKEHGHHAAPNQAGGITIMAKEGVNEAMSPEQKEAIYDLQNILDRAAELGDEARQIVKDNFPNELSAGDAYDVFSFGTSSNSYDKTLETLISDIERTAEEEDMDMDEGRRDNDALYPDNPRLPEIKNLADKIVSMVKAEADKGELGYIKTMEEIRYQQEDDFERTPEWNKAKGIRSDFDDYGSDTNEGVAKTQKAHGLVVARMKELAKQYRAGDKSVVAQLKDLTAKKKQLEKQLEKDVAGKNRGQQLDTSINEYRGVGDDLVKIIKDKAEDSGFSHEEETEEIIEFLQGIEFDDNGNIDAVYEEYKGKHQGSNYKWPMSQATKDRKEADKAAQAAKKKSLKEEKSTCCGKCGRKHVKGTKCKTPYLKGKDHCRTR